MATPVWAAPGFLCNLQAFRGIKPKEFSAPPAQNENHVKSKNKDKDVYPGSELSFNDSFYVHFWTYFWI